MPSQGRDSPVRLNRPHQRDWPSRDVTCPAARQAWPNHAIATLHAEPSHPTPPSRDKTEHDDHEPRRRAYPRPFAPPESSDETRRTSPDPTYRRDKPRRRQFAPRSDNPPLHASFPTLTTDLAKSSLRDGPLRSSPTRQDYPGPDLPLRQDMNVPRLRDKPHLTGPNRSDKPIST